jgi:tetratricopeptide (TPR) repeat protein
MTIQSSITELGLFDLFQILHLHKKTGRLMISDGPNGKETQVVFENGHVGFAFVHDRASESIKSLLIKWGVVNESSYDDLEQKMPQYDSFMDCLCGEGIMPKAYLEKYISSRIQESVYEIFKWDTGVCRFIEGELDRKKELIIPLNTENLILEGARRIDEWSNIEARVPSPHSIFRFCSEDHENQGLNLKPKEWELLSLIDGNRSVNEANELVGGDLFTTSKLIYGLVVMKVIQLVEDDVEPHADLDMEDRRIQELMRKGKYFFTRLDYRKASAEFEKIVQIDPDCFDAVRMLGEIYYKAGMLSEALIYLRKARASRPNNQKAIFIKGHLHARMGDVGRAIAEWEELLEKSSSPKVKKLVEDRLTVAKEWEKVLQEY